MTILPGRLWLSWSRVSVLSLLCLFASFHVENIAAQECYCNSGDLCVNNTCGFDRGQCMVELVDWGDGHYTLEYKCLRHPLICISRSPHMCCKAPNCNECQLPEFSEGGIRRPEELDDSTLLSLLPLECTQTNTTQSLPTSSRVSTDTTQSGSPESTEVPAQELSLPWWLYTIISLSLLVAFLSVAFVAVILWVCRRRRHGCEVGSASIGSLSISEMESFPDEVTLSNDSGGLKHIRILEPRTIGQQVSLKERLAKGGFGEVWRGDLNGEPVAVKVFSPLLEDCWKKEQEIYLTNMLHHENILRFIAVDCKLIDYSQKLIIIVEYHPHGSLFDYLSKNTISSVEFVKLMSSAINGIAFLHKPVTTSFLEREKPAIAHRDIKTKNILIKRDGTCCIADFGLSVKSDEFKGEKKLPDPIKGTKRYMAPEVLSRTISGRDFQSFIMVDIYAFGLVLWETARRCGDIGEVGEYQVPYENCVPNDPSIEDMKKVVVTDEVRPDIDERWMKNEVLSVATSIMRECWKANPHSRLSAFRIKKKLQTLLSEIKDSVVPTKQNVHL